MESLNSTNASNVCEFNPVSSLSKGSSVFQAVFLMLSLVVSLLLNASFAIIVIIYKELHQKEMIVNVFLAISNIGRSVAANTTSIASVINGGWPFGKPFCYATGTIGLFLQLLRFTYVLAITVDRFGVVMYPFQYPKHSAKVTALVFTIGSLYGVALPLLISGNFFGCYKIVQFAQMCLFQIYCNEIWCYAFVIVQLLTIISLGIVVPLVLNIIMFYKAKKLRTTVTCGTIGNVDIVGPGVNDIQDQNMRAIVTIALLLAAIIGLTSPYVTFVFMKAVLGFDVAAGSLASVAAILTADVYLLVPIADALVIWRNRDVKECIKPLYQKMCKIFKQST